MRAFLSLRRSPAAAEVLDDIRNRGQPADRSRAGVAEGELRIVAITNVQNVPRLKRTRFLKRFLKLYNRTAGSA
jgi:hypothetical protein